MFIEKNNENQLGIIITNCEKSSQTTYKLFTRYSRRSNWYYNEFETELTLPSSDFQKIIGIWLILVTILKLHQ